MGWTEREMDALLRHFDAPWRVPRTRMRTVG